MTSAVLLPEDRGHIYEKSKAQYNSQLTKQWVLHGVPHPCPHTNPELQKQKGIQALPNWLPTVRVTPATSLLTWRNVCSIRGGFRIPGSLPLIPSWKLSDYTSASPGLFLPQNCVHINNDQTNLRAPSPLYMLTKAPCMCFFRNMNLASASRGKKEKECLHTKLHRVIKTFWWGYSAACFEKQVVWKTVCTYFSGLLIPERTRKKKKKTPNLALPTKITYKVHDP